MIEKFFLLLQEALQVKKIHFSESQIQLFVRHYELLLKWNEKVNLTSVIDPQQAVWLHFIDSLLFVETEKFQVLHKTVVDIGSGAGFPGIVMAIACPQLTFLLFDSNAKKTMFLKNVVSELDLKNVKVIHQNIKEYIQQKKKKFDIAVARALMPWPQWCEIAKKIISDDGVFFLTFGRNPPSMDEIKNTARLKEKDHLIEKYHFDLEGVSHQRTLFSIQKILR